MIVSIVGCATQQPELAVNDQLSLQVPEQLSNLTDYAGA